MKTPPTHPSEHVAKEIKTSWHVVLSFFAWGLSIALSVAVLKSLSEPKLFLGISALLINIGIGLAVIAANLRWLKALDEMLRKIWIESMAMTLGALWIAFGCLLILDAAGINKIGSLEIGLLTMVAGLGMASGAIRILNLR